MTFIADAELNAKLDEARELGRQEGWMTAKSLFLRKVSEAWVDAKVDGKGRDPLGKLLAWQSACNFIQGAISGYSQPKAWANLEVASVLSGDTPTTEAYLAAAKILVEVAPDLAQQLADRFAEHGKKDHG